MVKVLKLVNKHVIVEGTKSIWRVGTLSTACVYIAYAHVMCTYVHNVSMYSMYMMYYVRRKVL